MLEHICLHACDQRTKAAKTSIMIVSNDEFFATELVNGLEKPKRGFEIFSEIPTGMVTQSMYQLISR